MDTQVCAGLVGLVNLLGKGDVRGSLGGSRRDQGDSVWGDRARVG